ncbi:MAG: hypothetical protein HY744_27190 [Deltaproteobacteria bacterium]|nr:hypothetical protein [Deltaproteobacteria bacterium]
MVAVLLVPLALCVCAASVAACGGGGRRAKAADVEPGPMPKGATWKGIWYSPLYGWLHLLQEGSQVRGRWERPRKDQWGELKGTAEGNVLRYEWIEHTIGRVGIHAKYGGKGYFVYRRPPGDNAIDEIAGNHGRGEDEVGLPEWTAVLQINEVPHPETIGGSDAQDIGGGDWDSSKNREAPEPEPPAEPPGEEPSL